MFTDMSDVTQILSAIEAGDQQASEELLPLVYDELRKLAAAKLAHEKPGQTLQATALVHEAYVRLVDAEEIQHWDSRGHFFTAAAEAIRRILIERARRKAAVKRGGDRRRINIDDIDLVSKASACDLVTVDDAIAALSCDDPAAAQIVKLRYFAGLTIEQAARIVGVSTATGYRHWTYARAWLHGELFNGDH